MCIRDRDKDILGLSWDHSTDCFSFPPLACCSNAQVQFTKRIVLSQMAQLFDPCGWLSPVIFMAKAFFEKLWAEGLDWDAPLSDDVNDYWSQFLSLSLIHI